MKYLLLCLFLAVSSAGTCQIGFSRNNNISVNNSGPLQSAWAGGINFPVFSSIDLNGDNLQDLFVFDRSNNRPLTYVNNGSSGIQCWDYAPEFADRFPEMKGWAYLYDYNCDGKPDMFTTSYYNNGIAKYRNESQGGNLIFTLVDSTMSYNGGGPIPYNIFASSYLVPNLDDIDGDGDMDVLGQQFQCAGGFAYYKNMSMEHHGICDSLDDYILVTNVWGNFTLRSGAYSYVAVGNYNVTCFQSPFNGNSYEIAQRDDTYANIRTIDIDGDGDKDALIGDSQADNSLLLINGGTPSSANMVPPQDTLFPSYDIPVLLHSFTTNSFIDVDNDGLRDLIFSQSEYENNKGILYYKNTGTNTVPVFQFQANDFLQSQMIDVGEAATPVFFDYNSDGLKDLVIGNKLLTTTTSSYTTGLTLYENTGTLSAPSFQFVTKDYAGIESLSLPGQIFPAFGDLDGDNDQDMILGLDNGRLGYFENTAGPGVPAVFAAPVFNYMGIFIGQASTPQLFDLNQDGLLDLIVGKKNGFVNYFQNVGTSSSPFFLSTPTNDSLGGINVQIPGSPDGYSVPFFFEQNGNLRLLVSSLKGVVYLYGNIDANINGNFTVLDTINKKSGGYRFSSYNLSVSGADLNNDSLVDIVLGFYGGGVQILYQDTLVNSIAGFSKQNIFSIFPNPASDQLIIKSGLLPGRVRYRFYDMTGREVLSGTINGNYEVLNLSKVSAGVYFIQFSIGDITQTEKVIVTR